MPGNLTNIEAVLKYDNDQPLVTTRALANEAPHDDEHAAQCLVFEILRGWIATGMTVAQYDNTTPEFARDMVLIALERSKLNVAAPGWQLTPDFQNSAQTVGESFFSQGYQATIDALTPENKVTFTKTGGLL